MKYRKKPVVIEAIQWIGDNVTEVGNFLGPDNRDWWREGENILIRTLEGIHQADKSDWIIRGIKGEFYPCKPDIFDKTYELVGH